MTQSQKNGILFLLLYSDKTTYINGHRATKEDRARLAEDIRRGTQSATVHRTRAGAFAFITEF